MKTVLVATGLRVDRAWTQFDPVTGSRLREWSREMLDGLAAATFEHGVDAVVIVGDLFDRQTTRPSTVAEVQGLLSALPVPVVVVPGVEDWVGPGSPFTYSDWTSVEVARTALPSPSANVPGWEVAAVTRPNGVLGSLPDGEPGRVVVTPDYIGAVPEDAFVVTSGPTLLVSDETRAVVTPLADPHGSGVALLVREDRSVDPLQLAPCPLTTLHLEISACETTAELLAVLDRAIGEAGDGLVWIWLHGTVRAGVLLPGYAEWAPRPGVTLEMGPLDFAAAPVPDPDIRSADAEFLRAMSKLGDSSLEQHQAIALGLLALSVED